MRKITAALLTHLEACPPAIETFKKTFPNGAPVSHLGYQTARNAGLNLRWFGSRIMPSAFERNYNNDGVCDCLACKPNSTRFVRELRRAPSPLRKA